MTSRKQKKTKWIYYCSVKGHFVHRCALAARDQGSPQHRCPAGCLFYMERVLTGSHVLWVLWLPFALLFTDAPCVCIDHNPPFFAFSSHFHFPKSIYEGNFGCGYLKERRASGLVFCENTTSVYRALFVSSLVFSPLCFNGDCENVDWTSLVEWRGMLFIFLARVLLLFVLVLCLICKRNTAVTNLVTTSDDEMNKPAESWGSPQKSKNKNSSMEKVKPDDSFDFLVVHLNVRCKYFFPSFQKTPLNLLSLLC